MFESLRKEFVPIGYTAEELADVDEVEMVLGIRPGQI